MLPNDTEWHAHFLGGDSFPDKTIKGGLLKAVPAEVIGDLHDVAEGG
jgi:hypothetical protein